MRLIHCADLHLDSALVTNLSAGQAADGRVLQVNTYIRMVQYAVDHQADGIMIAGDWFDSSHVSRTVLQAVRRSITDHPQLTFFYVNGNHDAAQTLFATCPENLVIFGKSFYEYRLAGVVISGIALYDRSMEEAADEMVFDEDETNILILHGQVSENRSDGKKGMIALPLLQDRGIDYLALGHYHSYQCQKYGNRMLYCYPGCPEGRGFDETGEKGFAVVEINTEKCPGERVSVQFIPFAKRYFFCIEEDVTDCKEEEDVVKLVLSHFKQSDLHSCVKLCLTGSKHPDWKLDLTYIQKRLEPHFEILRIENQISRRIAPKEYCSKISLEGEFVRTVLNESLTDNEKEEIIRIGLDALSDELS